MTGHDTACLLLPEESNSPADPQLEVVPSALRTRVGHAPRRIRGVFDLTEATQTLALVFRAREYVRTITVTRHGFPRSQ